MPVVVQECVKSVSPYTIRYVVTIIIAVPGIIFWYLDVCRGSFSAIAVAFTTPSSPLMQSFNVKANLHANHSLARNAASELSDDDYTGANDSSNELRIVSFTAPIILTRHVKQGFWWYFVFVVALVIQTIESYFYYRNFMAVTRSFVLVFLVGGDFKARAEALIKLYRIDRKQGLASDELERILFADFRKWRNCLRFACVVAYVGVFWLW